MRITIMMILVTSAIVGGCTPMQTQRPGEGLIGSRLPGPNSEVHRLLKSLAFPVGDAEGVREYYEAAAEAMTRREFTDEVWLTQILLFTSRMDGTEGAVAQIVLMTFAKQFLQIRASRTVEVLAPFIDSPTDAVSAGARDMISIAGAFDVGSRSIGNRLDAREFDALRAYLRKSDSTPAFWEIVRTMYIEEPDVSLNTAARVYLTRDQQQLAFRQRKELTILLYSLDVASDEQKPELQRRVLAKLAEMTQHPHWCVRGYAMQLTLVEGKADLWSQDLAIPHRLSTEPNPFVSGLAQYILELAKDREQKEKLLNPSTGPKVQQ